VWQIGDPPATQLSVKAEFQIHRERVCLRVTRVLDSGPAPDATVPLKRMAISQVNLVLTQN
jgi:hypothetical protein